MCTGHIKWPSRSLLRCWRPGRLTLGQTQQLSAAQGLTRMGRKAPTRLSMQYPGAQQRKHALLCSLKWGRQHSVIAARYRRARLDVPWCRLATALLPDELLQHG